MLENHQVIGEYYEKPEAVKTKIECFCCGETIYEGANYQVFRNDKTEKEVVICEDCQSTTKWQTAWND